MIESCYIARNRVNRFLYKNIVKRIFFLFEPENIHDIMTAIGKFLGSNIITRRMTSCLFSYSNKMLNQEIRGIKFPNPVGLAAGFDKEAQLLNIMPSVGFGFVEVGSVTGEPCKGNKKPRLWRLKKSRSLLVNYGLKNAGSEAISKKLADKSFNHLFGINIAKTNDERTDGIEEAIADYAKAYQNFANIGSYTTINISCPNVTGCQPFMDAKLLDKLLTKIDSIPSRKPVFLKLTADADKKVVDKILIVAKKHKVSGFICSNLTKNRKNKKILDRQLSEKGGLSGKPVEELSNALIKYIFAKTKGKYIIIGCGGIFSAEDAYMKIKLGASLVQLITGMIFEGPQLQSEINHGIVKLLKKEGFSNISEAIGSGNTA